MDHSECSRRPIRLGLLDVANILHDVHHMENFFQLIIDRDPKEVAENFENIDYGGFERFVGMSLHSSFPADEFQYVWDSPLAAQVCNYLEEKFKDRNDNINVMIQIYTWLTFNLDRITSRLKQKFGGLNGEEALEAIEKRRTSGCSSALQKPVDPDFDKKVREEVEKIIDEWKAKFEEIGFREQGLLKTIGELREEKESLEEKTALQEKRIARLEQENRASADAKRRLNEEIKNITKAEEEMKEKARLLEEEKNETNKIWKAVAKQMSAKVVLEQENNKEWECKEAMMKEEKAVASYRRKLAESTPSVEEKENIKKLEEENALLKKEVASFRRRSDRKKEKIKKLEEEIGLVYKDRDDIFTNWRQKSNRVDELEKEKSILEEEMKWEAKEEQMKQEKALLVKAVASYHRKLAEATSSVEENEKIKQLEEENGLLKKDNLSLKEKLSDDDYEQARTEKKNRANIKYLQERYHELEEENGLLKRDNLSLKDKLSASECEKAKKEEMSQERIHYLQKIYDDLVEKYKKAQGTVKGYEEEMTKLKGMNQVSEKANSGENKKNGSKKQGTQEASEKRLAQVRLLLPFLIDKELAQKTKAIDEDYYKKVVDYFAVLGLHADL